MESPWTSLAAGIVLCAGGLYLFFKNVFEEDKSIVKPLLIVVAGIVLIAVAMAEFYHIKF
ncbi:MAG TPA: hypothetical protein VFD56_00770 [Chitinophagaceae bacterium]|nr:hypothetical protein [Chitinophagaceae bacterium]